jgi:hypothetical protein
MDMREHRYFVGVGIFGFILLTLTVVPAVVPEDTPNPDVEVVVEENYIHFYPTVVSEDAEPYRVLITADVWEPRHGLSGDGCSECYIIKNSSDSSNTSHVAVRIVTEDPQIIRVVLEYNGDYYILSKYEI